MKFPFHVSIGLAYWRCNSRKFFAVPQYKQKRSKPMEAARLSLDSSDNSDDDFQTPTAAKRRHISELKTLIDGTLSSIGDNVDQVLNKVVSLETTVDMQADDIRDLKRSMENEGRETRAATKRAIQQVKAASSLPLPLLDKLQTDLQCSV